MKKLFHLSDLDASWQRMVILADDEQEARALATKADMQSGGEWLNPEESECVEVDTDKSQVVLNVDW